MILVVTVHGHGGQPKLQMIFLFKAVMFDPGPFLGDDFFQEKLPEIPFQSGMGLHHGGWFY